MIHARSDYDCIQPWPIKRPHTAKIDNVTHTNLDVDAVNIKPIIPDDEPVFLVRGQDVAAVPTLEAWCKAAEEAGADGHIILTVRDHIELIQDWQKKQMVKIPDAPNEVLR